MTGLALLAAVAVLPDDGAAVEERYDVADLLTGPGGSVPASTLLGPITRVTGRADNCWFRDEQTLPHFGGRLGLRPRADGCWFRDEQTLRVEGHTLVVRRPHAVQAEVSALLSALRHADRTGVRLRGGPAVREVEPPAAVDYGTLRVDGASLAVEVGSPSVTTFRAVPPVCAASVSSRPGLLFRRPAPAGPRGAGRRCATGGCGWRCPGTDRGGAACAISSCPPGAGRPTRSSCG